MSTDTTRNASDDATPDGVAAGPAELSIGSRASDLVRRLFLPLALAAVYWQNNDLLWASLVAFMVARTVTLWWAGRYLPVFGATSS